MCKVISIADRLEQWERSYADADGHMTVYVSSNARMKFEMNGESTVLSTVESVALLTSLSKSMSNIIDKI